MTHKDMLGLMDQIFDSVTDTHTGAIVYEIMDDTEATLGSNPFQKIVSGTFSWSTGQARTVTVTCDEDHGLTDTSNRVYISNASQRVANAVNGLWNVATITSSTAFTIMDWIKKGEY